MPIPVSCEFFPPKSDEGAVKLRSVYQELARAIDPEYFSVTFGAGGSTQTRTFETVREIQRDSGVPAAPHLSCIGSTREGIAQILDDYREQGIRRIVALRGDLPSGMRDPGDFRYANELVAFIREYSGDWFRVEVAAYPEFHPQAPDAETDLANFKRKVEAGADAAITQYFYSIEAYRRFLDDCERLNIEVPIVPGVMPITNYQ
ncbi:MAG: methylenetetrahydrofolate reductase, partial [Guyparkeria sp.]